MAPTLVNFNGRKVLMPMREEVPQNTTYADIMPLWINTSKKPKESVFGPSEFEIPNSKGTGFYTVTRRHGQWNCTCVGFGFRRKCKHIEIAKSQLK